MVWPLGLQKPGLSDRDVAKGVTKFRMASGGLIVRTTQDCSHKTITENKIHIGTSQENFAELEEEFIRKKLDVIGIAEVRRSNEKILETKNKKLLH